MRVADLFAADQGRLEDFQAFIVSGHEHICAQAGFRFAVGIRGGNVMHQVRGQIKYDINTMILQLLAKKLEWPADN